MSSTNRLRAKAGRALALGLAAAFAAGVLTGAPARATIGTDFWFAGARLPLAHPQLRAGQVAVATDDPGLARLLTKLGAVLSYEPGQRYVVVTTADRRTITFTLGAPQFAIGTIAQQAAFAPYVSGSSAYLPFADLARALYVDPVDDGTAIVLQPQLAALDVRTEGALTLVTLRGAAALPFKRLSAPGDATLSLAFRGTASTLEAQRTVNGPTLRDVTIATTGLAKNPTTVVTFTTAPGSAYALAPADSPNAVALAFGPAGVALGGMPVPAAVAAPGAAGAPLASDPRGAVAAVSALPPPPQPPPPPVQQPVTSVQSDGVVQTQPGSEPLATATPTADGLAPAAVTGVDTQSNDGGIAVHLAVTGAVTYEWHRLSDDRWYVDLKPATLTIPAQDQPLDDPSLLSLRVKPFVGPNDHLPTVRVALSLASPRGVELVPTPDGLTLAVDAQDDATGLLSGTGELAGGKLSTAIVPLPVVAAAPPADQSAPGSDQPWKFAQPVARNPKMIVIDPGHGGSDRGAMHNGLVEAELNLDVAKRLEAILIARGWQVKMTRETDVDVYQPNDSARDELQARDDIANAAGARLLVSVHTNSFTTSELSGTTTYYYTPASRPLAEAVHARLAASLPTTDDGIRKENFYVIHHQHMPGILVEMAFLSNPADAKLLKTQSFLQSVAVAIADGIGDYAAGGNSQQSNANADTDGN